MVNGTQTSAYAAPLPSDAETNPVFARLEAISCWAVNRCVAVGTYGSWRKGTSGLIETWNGSTWIARRAPGVGSTGLDHVACNAQTCVASSDAFGDYVPSPLVVRNSQGAWSNEPISVDGTTDVVVDQITCPATGSCVAVGVAHLDDGVRAPLYLYPSGDGWRGVRFPAPNHISPTSVSIDGISCAANRQCTAVGSYRDRRGGSHALAERLIDGRLSAHQLPIDPAVPADTSFGPFGISCWEPTECVAYGNNQSTPVMYRLDGTRWTTSTPQHLSATFADIDCSSEGACVAVGTGDGTKAAEATYRESDGAWLPKKFSAADIDNAFVAASFASVSCAARVCVTVGQLTRDDMNQTPHGLVGVGRGVPAS